MRLPGRELLFDGVKGGVLTLALFLAYITFPVLGLAAGVLAPLPAIYYYFRRGAVVGALIFAITLSVLMIMGGASVPMLYLLQAGLTGMTLPLFYLQGKGAARAIAYSVGINFLLIVIVALAYGFWSGADLQGILLKGINSSTEQAVAIYGKQGLSPEDLELLTQGIRQAGSLIARIFPALLLVTLGSIAALNMAVIARLREKRLPDIPEPEELLSFRNPDILVWVVIAGGFALLVPAEEINRAGLNVLVVCGFVYFIQGLAVVLAFFKRITVPSFARIIFWLVLAFQPYLVMALAILGLFDIWGDFRVTKQKNL
jgi:uncharacterized protein YybS (DUF2232 family)